MGDKRELDSIPEDNPAKKVKADLVDDDGWDGVELPDEDDTEEACAMVAEMDREIIQSRIPRILGPEDVQKEFGSAVETQMEVLKLPKATVLQMLDHCCWNAELLQQKYYSDSRDKYFSDSGIFLPRSDEASSSSRPKIVECPICYCEFTPRVAGPPPPCGHYFCKACSFAYVEGLVNSTFGNCTLKCPAYECKVPLSDDYIRHVLRHHPLLLSKYERLQRNCFVEKNKNFKFCPGNGCEMAWKLDSTMSTFSEAKCHCGETFCFGCALPWHYPLNCELSKLWSRKIGDDSGTATWFMAFTKPCPKCQSPIEKNGGCNRMHCRKCQHTFCWLCMRDWSQHGYSYNCSRDRPNVKASAGRSHLERFTFTSDRFKSHAQSYRFEKKLLTGATKTMIDVQRECNLPNSADVGYYKDAVQTLLACRQLLQFSFPFAHYLEPGTEANIFEDNMVYLHESIEKLSGFLEGQDAKSPADIWNKKSAILNLAFFCEGRRQALIDHVHDGYQKGIWKFHP